MRSERMVKCRIVAPKSTYSSVISTLYDLGLFHVKEHEKQGDDALDIGEPLARAEKLSQTLLEINGIIGTDVAFTQAKPLDLSTFDEKSSEVSALYERMLAAREDEKTITSDLDVARSQLKHLHILKQFDVDLAALESSSRLGALFGRVNDATRAKEILSTYTHQFVRDYVLIVDRDDVLSSLDGALSLVGFSAQELDVSLLSREKELMREVKVLEKRQNVAQATIKEAQEQRQKLIALAAAIREEIRKQELPLQFAVTKRTFVAEGFLPQKDAARVKKALEQAANDAIHIEITEPQPKEDVPVKLSHSKIQTPFEFLLRLYNLPKYKELDPTSLVFITFPIFFGFMLGDFAYGVILALFFWFLKKKVPAAKDLASILMFAAIVSALFGLVYGEYLGFEYLGYETGKSLCENTGICLERAIVEYHGEQKVIWDFPRLLNRVHGHMNIAGFEILSVLVIGAIIGFLHINLGFLIGFINEYYSHGLKHAILAKLSWIVFQAGLILAVLGATGILGSPFSIVGIVLAVLGVLMLGIGEGVQGIVELPALFSNMLSYMRLGAVGLASVGLALVVNNSLAGPFFERGGIFILVGILIMLMGHGINLLLGVIGPFLHGIRLHYVEFFSKFYHGGGEAYKPFAMQKEMEEK